MSDGIENMSVGNKKEERGLSELVKQCLGKPLDKAQQMSDWERRPLRDSQINYAGITNIHYTFDVSIPEKLGSSYPIKWQKWLECNFNWQIHQNSRNYISATLLQLLMHTACLKCMKS